jgi:hypothetical protein
MGFPKQQRKSIFSPSGNPFNGPTVQGPDICRQLQRNNLPEPPQFNIFPPTQYYNFPKKW